MSIRSIEKSGGPDGVASETLTVIVSMSVPRPETAATSPSREMLAA